MLDRGLATPEPSQKVVRIMDVRLRGDLLPGLALERRTLSLNTPAIAAQFTIGPHSSVAWNGYSEWVGGAGLRYRTNRLRSTDL
jgi:hypothetical protein